MWSSGEAKDCVWSSGAALTTLTKEKDCVWNSGTAINDKDEDEARRSPEHGAKTTKSKKDGKKGQGPRNEEDYQVSW